MLISSLLTIMSQSLRKASKSLVRDFSEIGYLQNSSQIGSFIKSSYLKSAQIIADELLIHHPSYKIMLDRENEKYDEKDYIWFINPMDSKTNFINSLAFFTTSVALIHDDEALAAVIHCPILKETFYAEKGRGSFAEDFQAHHMKMRVRNKKSLQMAVIDSNLSTPLISSIASVNNMILRSMGSTNLGYAYLGSSRYDALIYSRTMHKYKARVGELFARESSGKASYNNNVFIASNIDIHDILYSKLCTKKE